MYMYMYVCMYMYICIYICMHVYVCMYIVCMQKDYLKLITTMKYQYYNFHFTKVRNSYINIGFIEKVNR